MKQTPDSAVDREKSLHTIRIGYMKKVLMLVYCVALVTLVTSCNMFWPTDSVIDTNTTTTSSNDYYPLAVGNSWTYLPGKGINTLVRTVLYTRVESEKKVGNGIDYTMVDSLINGDHSDVTRYILHKEGSIIWKNEEVLTVTDWTINFDATQAKPGDDSYGFVQDRPKEVIVWAGTFDKDNVGIFFPAAAYDGLPFMTFARGVGLVRITGFRMPWELSRAVIDGKIIE